MKLYLSRYVIFFILSLLSTSIVVAQKPVAKKPVAKKTVAVAVAAKPYANGIKLNVKGLVVKDAYLVFDDESKVPTDNKVDLNQRVTLRIILNKGFKEVNGKVFPGGTEKIALSNGETILDSEDLYTAFDSTGASPADALYISLKAVITEIKDKNNYVIVSVKVWDKKTEANVITASYKLYIK